MISRGRWQRLEPILDAVLDLPPEDAAAELDRRCADDPELRTEVERLLGMVRGERRGARFLDTPPMDFAVHALADRAGAAAAGDLAEGAAIGPYVVLRRLGHGGMGVVYLARDPRLDRLVALKLLPPWLAADERATRRLVTEAKAASALDHPNIATVYDIGSTADGRPYLAMAYYEGETLDARIRRGPLPVEDAVAVAAQLAQGLEAAHGHGIVHRDIKPANVIVTPDGTARILDFGVAKATGSDITEPGATPGTVAYMSPEQTRGQAIDARSDLWSLGVVLYEMLTGRRPFSAEGSEAVIYATRHDEPERVDEVRAGVPAPLARVVHRCLAKDPAARYRDAASLAKALRRAGELATADTAARRARRRRMAIGAGVLGVAVLLGGTVFWPRIQPVLASLASDDAAAAVTTRLAVLPLADSSSDSADTYFATGLTEDLIARLSSVGALRATALASVLPYQGTDKGVAEIARELGVGSVLLGTVSRLGEQLRLSVRLVNAGSQELWANAYAVPLGDVGTVQQDIAEHVVSALRVAIGARERRQLAKRGTDNAEAYTEYLKGRYFVDRADTWTARDHFERALNLDPMFAAAWGGLARTYIQSSIRELVPTGDAFPRARAAAERALELDPDLADAHAHLAAALNWYYWDTDGAERHLRRALDLDPSAAWVYRALAVHLRNLGRFDEALDAAAKVRELDPLNSAGPYQEEGTILYMARRYHEAMDRFRQLLRVEPANTSVYFYVALVYRQLGQYDSALAALDMVDPELRTPSPLALRAHVHALMGERDEARRMLSRLEALPAAQPLSPFTRAVVVLGQGDHARALDLLEQAAEGRPWQMRLLRAEPMFDPLRGEPRFQVLLERMHLAG